MISGDGYWHLSGEFPGPVTSNYHTAATDVADARAWIRSIILDIDDVPEGTCVGPDDDDDGIPNGCDSCPHVHNPEQLTTIADDDLDGIGNACDACPQGPGGALESANRNLEIELAVAFPLLNEIPLLREADFDSEADLEAAAAELRAAVRPDACDPMPIPLQQLRDGGSLPTGAVNPVDGPECDFYTRGCSSEFRNVIDVNVTTSAAIQAAGPTRATVGLRWCDCRPALAPNESSIDTGAHAGRTRCRNDATAGCVYNESFYSQPGTKWEEMVVDAGGGYQPAPTLDMAVGGAKQTVLWDFTQLDPTHVVRQSNHATVNGILWTHVESLNRTIAVPGMTSAEIRRFADSIGDGNAHWIHGRQGHLRSFISYWFECPTCPFTFRQAYFERSYPEWRMTVDDASTSVNPPPDAVREFHDRVLDGEILDVPASEPLSVLKRTFLGSRSMVRAVGVELDGSIVALESSSLDAFASSRTKQPTRMEAATTASPSLPPDAGVAFSATRARLYVVGGTSNGQPVNEGRMFDLEGAAWRSFSFPEGEDVGAVLSAVYRTEDNAVYFLDRDASGRVRLRRWNAQRRIASNVVETLLELGSRWKHFVDYALVAGEGGDLGLAAWNGKRPAPTRIARLSVDARGRVDLSALRTEQRALAGAPYMAADAFFITTFAQSGSDDPEPIGGRIAFSELAAPGPSDRPLVHPH